MLKRATEEGRDDGEEDYRRVRDRAVVAIRKCKREDIFNKRRNEGQLRQQSSEEAGSEEEEFEQPIVIAEAHLEQQIRQISRKQLAEEDLPSLVDMIQSEEFSTVLEGVISIRRLLMVKLPPTMQVIELGAHKKLIELTSHASAQIRMQALWSLANVAIGESGECGFLVEKGVIPSFLGCLQEESILLVEQGVWGLGNICIDSVTSRDLILQDGGIAMLIEIVHKFQNPDLTKLASWAVVNLCRGKPRPRYKLVQQGVLLLCCLLESECITEEDQLADILLAISFHCSGEKRTDREMQSLLDTQFVLSILAFTGHYDNRLVESAVNILSRLLTGKAKIINYLLKLKILDYLERCLHHQVVFVKEQACCALALIASSHQKHVQFLFSRKSLIKALQNCMVCDVDDVRTRALQVFVSMGENCGLEVEIEKFYVEAEVIVVLVEFLGAEEGENVLLALQGLYNILQRADERDKGDLILDELDRNGGFPLLHHLQYCDNKQIAYESLKIISKFIGEAEIKSLIV